jgi:hypothetical protein
VLQYLPATSNGIIHADLGAIRGTPFASRTDAFLTKVLGDLALKGSITKVASITWALAWDAQQSSPARQVMVVRGPSLDDVGDALVGFNGKKPRFERDGAIVRAVFDDATLTFAYPEDRTVVFFMFEADPPVEDLRRLVDDGAPLRRNPDFMSRFGKVSTGQVWAIGNLDPFELIGPLASSALQGIAGVRNAYARIQITNQLDVESHHIAQDKRTAAELALRTRDEQAAKSSLLGELLANATAPRIEANGEDVRVAFTMTEQQVSGGHDIWARWFEQAGK